MAADLLTLQKKSDHLFNSFKVFRIATQDANFFVRVGGQGPAVVLLHGFPQTHAMWHKIAPILAKHFTVIIPDQKGVGLTTIKHNKSTVLSFSNTQLATDVIAITSVLGFSTFSIIGHSTGALIATHTALDNIKKVENIVLIDAVPNTSVWNNLNSKLLNRMMHWPFLAKNKPGPEKMIQNDPITFINNILQDNHQDLKIFDTTALELYQQGHNSQEAIINYCNYFRALKQFDYPLDTKNEIDQILVKCPTLIMYAEHGLAALFDNPIKLWANKCSNVRGVLVECGHHIPEEAPEFTASVIIPFLN